MALEERQAKILINKAGGTAGPEAKSYRVALPSAWMKALGILSAAQTVLMCLSFVITSASLVEINLDPAVLSVFRPVCIVSFALTALASALPAGAGRFYTGISGILQKPDLLVLYYSGNFHGGVI